MVEVKGSWSIALADVISLKLGADIVLYFKSNPWQHAVIELNYSKKTKVRKVLVGD